MAALSALAVAQPLLDLLARHGEFFVIRRLDRIDILLLVGCLVIVLPLPVIVLEVVVDRVSRRAGQVFHLAVIWSFSLLATLFVLRRLSVDSAVFVWSAAVAVATLFAATYSRAGWIRSFLDMAAIGVLVVPAAFFWNPEIVRLMTLKAPSMRDLPRLECDAPVVFLVFDEWNALVLVDEDGRINRHRYPNLARLADGATWYRNTVTVAESTEYALPAILTGRSPVEGTKPWLADHPRNLFTLFGGSYSVWAEEAFTSLCPEELNQAEREDVTAVGEAVLLGSDLAVVYLHLVLPPASAQRLPSISATWQGFAAGGADDDAGPDTSANPRFFKRALEALDEDRRTVFDRLDLPIGSLGSRDLVFCHMLLPHRPWELLPDGVKYATGRPSVPGLVDRHWDDSPIVVQQAFQRYVLQSMYVDAQIGRLVDELDRRGVFDDALIVLVADHGVSFSRNHAVRWISETNAHEIMRVPLIIKAPHQVGGRVVEGRVDSTDILPTVLDLLGQPSPWPLDGESRVEDGSGSESVPVVLTAERGFVEVDWNLERDFDRAVVRKVRLFGDGSDPDDLYRWGPSGEIVGRSIDDVPRLEDSPWSAVIDDREAFDTVDLTGDTLPVFVRGDLRRTGDRDTRFDLAIVVNGRIAATTTTYRLGSRGQHFSAMIQAEALQPGSNELELFRIVRRDNEVMLRQVPVG